MNRKLSNRCTAGALTAALALGAAGPAAARQIDVTPQGSSVPAGSLPHYEKATFPPDMPPLHMPYYGEVLPPLVPAHMKAFPETTAAPVPTTTPRAVVNRPSTGGSSDLVYILVGGGIAVAVTGLGGAREVSRRRTARTTAPARPNIAA
jgi:hypothetical protein